MSLQTQPCDSEQIAQFLNGQLTERQVTSFEEHLSDCGHCRASLENQTADLNVWNKVGLYLRDDEGELQPLSSLSSSPGELRGHSASIKQVLDSLAPTDDPAMIGRIDGYEISGVIGCGGMGAVLKGFDRSLNRVVAVKVMAPHLATSGAARKRFAREAQAAAAMTHDNVIDIYGVSEANGLPYLVMPYARGPSLQKRINDAGALPLVEVLRIGVQIASGLAAAHAQGLVHRDIKPANILLSDGIERLVITDFGLARAVDDASVTRTGVIAGTPQYMSPEQARGDAVDHRSDLFSLGSVLYTVCAGRVPFRADSGWGILRRITDTEPREIREINSEVPEWLCRVISRLHAKEAKDRYQTATEVAVILQECLVHVQTPNALLPEELRPKVRRPQILRFVLIAVVVLCIDSTVRLWPDSVLVEPQRPTAVDQNGGSKALTASPAPSRAGTPLESVPEELMWETSLAPMIRSLEQTAEHLATETLTPFDEERRQGAK